MRRLRCAVFSSFLIVSLIYGYLLSRQHLPSHVPVQSQCSDEFSCAIAGRASGDKYIILAIVDVPVIDMALNLYESSFQPHNIENFLFVGLGQLTCQILSASSVPCFYYADVSTANRPSVYGSSEFLKKMTVRNKIVSETLKLGFTVMLTDLDVIFLRNPLPHIKV
jgi:hypothetical protein